MRTVDLFCGCGGMSLGFQAAEYELVAAFENWDFAANCYRNNFHHPVFENDLSNVRRLHYVVSIVFDFSQAKASQRMNNLF